MFSAVLYSFSFLIPVIKANVNNGKTRKRCALFFKAGRVGWNKENIINTILSTLLYFFFYLFCKWEVLGSFRKESSSESKGNRGVWTGGKQLSAQEGGEQRQRVRCFILPQIVTPKKRWEICIWSIFDVPCIFLMMYDSLCPRLEQFIKRGEKKK